MGIQRKRRTRLRYRIHEYKNEFVICEFMLENDICKIYSYGGEPGKVPHFHVQIGKDKISIRLDAIEYYDHKLHNKRLTPEQKAYIDNILRQKHDLDNDSNWEVLRFVWNTSAFNEIKMPKTSQPDYRLL